MKHPGSVVRAASFPAAVLELLAHQLVLARDADVGREGAVLLRVEGLLGVGEARLELTLRETILLGGASGFGPLVIIIVQNGYYNCHILVAKRYPT